ncbi:hypothetical protein NEOLEDRAFT_1180546 [Neolentinus lepideus HHB14362 ss-1]|uniref:Uncharacterized protein n=1 Tax=Neolentinus lepideus HHB14362 ss-1 TaxID=1314782 RepID=A0A165QS00_9AGAM|nr:hypothetical protein NEOLEDRAFT_1180546 [Neolentinus lepideus HHB14362 ss-1]
MAYPTPHLAERYFLDHPLACTSLLEDYPLYGHADETEECVEVARDYEPTGKDGGEEEEAEGWGLNNDKRDKPEEAEKEDSENECDRALVVDEDGSDNSSSLVDSSEEEANVLIAKYTPHDVAPSLV